MVYAPPRRRDAGVLVVLPSRRVRVRPSPSARSCIFPRKTVANPLLSRRDVYPHHSHVECTRLRRWLPVPPGPPSTSPVRAPGNARPRVRHPHIAHRDMFAYFPQPPHDSHLPTDLPPCASPCASHVPPPHLRPTAPALFSTIWTGQLLRGGSRRPRWTRIRPQTCAGSRGRSRTSKERQRSPRKRRALNGPICARR
jgi:hypothetical protein